MKIYAFLNKQQVRPVDIERLKKVDANIYFGKNIKEVKDLFANQEEKVLLLQWTGLKNQGEAPISLITSIPNLKAVCISMTAYTWIDGPTLRTKNIDLCNCPDKSSDSVASYYFFMATGLIRNIATAFSNKGDKILPGRDMEGLKAGIVGLGSIGKRFAQLCAQNGMSVQYWDRKPKQTNYKQVALDKVFATSDVIFVSLAGNKDTQLIIQHEHINLMKKDAVIINCADDNLIDAKYIIDKVERGIIGGFAYETDDTIPRKHKGNVWAVPEIAYFTKNTLANESRIMTDTCLSYAKGVPINVVNK